MMSFGVLGYFARETFLFFFFLLMYGTFFTCGLQVDSKCKLPRRKGDQKLILMLNNI